MDSEKKIIPFDSLLLRIKSNKSEKKKIVHCHGCFDLLHPGHIKHFQSARKLGDLLIVTVTPDKYVDKGPNRPVFNQQVRLESIAAIECVDFVVLNKWPTAVQTLESIQPDYYVKGKEFEQKEDPTGKLGKEKEIVEKHGGKLVFTHDELVFSSTKLLNSFFNVLPEELHKKINILKDEYSLDDLFSILDSIAKLKILIVGDTIIDTYIYCRPLDRASKSNIVSTEYVNEEKGAGGALCIANHLSEFCKNVDIITVLGKEKSQFDFISKAINEDVNIKDIYLDGYETIEKKRYIDIDFKMKMFEIQNNTNFKLNKSIEDKLIASLELLEEYDLVLVSDFGQGSINRNIRNFILEKSNFLAATVQTNSTNLGFNYFTNYSKLNYLSIDERELRLGTQNREADIKEIIKNYKLLETYPKIAITQGRSGSSFFGKNKEEKMPIVTQAVIDTIGAGDAFFSLTSPLVFNDIDPLLVLLFGNIAGAIVSNFIGNSEHLSKDTFKKVLTSIYK